jgi:hypothetical protein
MGLFDIFSSDPAKKAGRAQIAAAEKGYDDAKAAIGKGRKEAYGFYDKALVPFTALYDKSMAGYGAYGDAAGINGPEGYERAVASFRTNPGYEFTIDQALQAINRNAAATGRLASGNTDIDVANYVTGLADQQWDDYVSRLAPYLQQPFQAAEGQADIYGSKAGVATNYGTNLATLAQGKAKAVGDAKANMALADYQASGNAWNAIMGGLGLGAKVLGFV